MSASTVIVRYELKPECLEEHVSLIETVFAHLNETAPEGVHYAAMRDAEGFGFTHVGHYETEEARAAASENDAFAAFTAEIADRCVTPPAPVPQMVVGQFGAFEQSVPSVAVEGTHVTCGGATVDIEASPEAVWDIVTDPARKGELSPECYRAEWEGEPAEPVVGARVHGYNRQGEFEWDAIADVTVAEPGQVFEVALESPDGQRTTWRYDIEPTGSGCRVTHSYDAPVLMTEFLRLYAAAPRTPEPPKRGPKPCQPQAGSRELLRATRALGCDELETGVLSDVSVVAVSVEHGHVESNGCGSDQRVDL